MSNIPQELRDLKQWVSFTYGPALDPKTGKPVKRPHIPGQPNTLASPTNPLHWRTFEEAAESGHPALALTENDPYVFIDYDSLSLKKGETEESLAARQQEADRVWAGVENTFVSYMEQSVSGKGVHVIGKGTLQGGGSQRKEYGIEIYDRGRFVIFTGNVVLDAPVSTLDAKALVKFEKWMRKESSDSSDSDPHDLEEPEKWTDEEVAIEACKFDWMIGLAKDGYRELGDWGFASQSEADFAFTAELFRACRNTEQVKRIFQQSPLYRAEKCWDYVEKATLRVKRERLVVEKQVARLTKSLAKISSPLPATPVPAKRLNIIKPSQEPEPQPAAESPPEDDDRDTFKKLMEDLPAGLIRDVCDSFLHYGHFPLCEGALVGALNMAQIAFSRAFQTSSGLALKGWIVLVGPTTCGKEIATLGPQALLKATEIPSVFQLVRGEPRSEQGLFRMLTETPRMLINVDECATWIKTMCDPKAPAFAAGLREALTKLYTKGDRQGVFHGTEKSEKNPVAYVERPCVSIYGDSQDDNLYSGLCQSNILTGFLPRFLFVDINYDGIAIESQEMMDFPVQLVSRVRDALKFTGIAEATGNPPVKVAVQPDVAERLKAYETKIRRHLFKEETALDGEFKMMHGRSAAKIAVYMSLLAVSADWKNPKVTMTHYRWAKRFVELCTSNIIANLTQGSFSSDVKEQRRAVLTALNRALDMPYEVRMENHYYTSEILAETAHAVPLSWLKNAVCRLRCFTNDSRRDLGTAIHSVLKELEEEGLFTLIDKDSSFKAFRARCPVICQLTDDYWQGKDEEED